MSVCLLTKQRSAQRFRERRFTQLPGGVEGGGRAAIRVIYLMANDCNCINAYPVKTFYANQWQKNPLHWHHIYPSDRR